MTSPPIRTTIYPTASGFLDAIGPALAEQEVEHHLLLGVATAAAAHPLPDEPVFGASVADADGLVLAALMTGWRPLLVSSVGGANEASPVTRGVRRPRVEAACAPLWDALGAQGRRPRHVIGDLPAVDVVVGTWAQREQRTPRLAMRQRLHALTAVQSRATAAGTLRPATREDLDLAAAWTLAFEREALGMMPPHSSRAMAERRIEEGELYLWCDPEPRAMAGSARPTAHTIAVNAVFTPPEWRGRGYATACVAALSTLLLEQGYARCVLYTDLANPTSNAIYARIGYEPRGDFLMYELPDA